MQRSWLLVCVGWFGCGDDGQHTPDAPPPGPPHIVSISPADQSPAIAVITSFTAVFDEPLDPATITSSAFTLASSTYGSTSPIDALVTYDDATTSVTVTPDMPIPHDVAITLVVDPTVHARGGEPFAGQTFRFRTTINERTRVVYSDQVGTVTSWQAWGLDGSGRPNKWLQYNGAGPNGTWLDGDDAVQSHSEYVYDPTTSLLMESRNYGAGPDAKLGTNDDPIVSATRFEYDAAERELVDTVYNTPGTDGIWDTADDHISGRTVYGYDSGGHSTNEVEYLSPGTDLIWGTTDDVINRYFAYGYTGDNHTSSVTFTGKGTDGIWMTADDTGTFSLKYEYDATNRMTRYTRILVGADQIPGTADDVTSFHVDYQRDPHGHTTRNTTYNGAGPDGIWLTSDDSVSDYFAFTFEDSNSPGEETTQTNYSSSGPDATWFTADDQGPSRFTFQYNAHHQQNGVSLFDMGVDNLFGTTDDRLVYWGDTTYDGSGNTIASRTLYGKGPDGVFHTADDVVTNSIDYDTAH